MIFYFEWVSIHLVFRKKVRYSYLESDIESNGFKCVNIPFEIGSRGHITMGNKTSLATVHKITKSKMKLSTYLQTISKISLLCSYYIYTARNEVRYERMIGNETCILLVVTCSQLTIGPSR